VWHRASSKNAPFWGSRDNETAWHPWQFQGQVSVSAQTAVPWLGHAVVLKWIGQNSPRVHWAPRSKTSNCHPLVRGPRVVNIIQLLRRSRLSLHCSCGASMNRQRLANLNASQYYEANVSIPRGTAHKQRHDRVHSIRKGELLLEPPS
jgi:hypothetical protein